MKYLLLMYFVLVSFWGVLRGGEQTPQTSTDSTVSGPAAASVNWKDGLFEGRKAKAVLYSLIIPGSGQTMLGSPYKGFSITFTAFGSALTTLISHNNFVASNERLDALEFQYKTATTWEVSNNLYTSMNETYTKLQRYKKMRNSFAIISAVVWTLNIADVMFNTGDEGEVIFSYLSLDAKEKIFASGLHDFQYALKLTLPLNYEN